LAATFGQPGSGKLDFNSASKDAMAGRLRDALARNGVPMAEPQLQKLVADILNFRDTPPRSGLIADFNQLIGDVEALEAFNVGWAFLHELDHVVNDSSDNAGLDETGECESHINAMRRECGLPSRAEYFFKFFPAADQSDFRTRFVRIAFDKTDAKTNKRHRYWVTWDAVIVGGLQVATAR